jgi:hypothetical protein
LLEEVDKYKNDILVELGLKPPIGTVKDIFINTL